MIFNDNVLVGSTGPRCSGLAQGVTLHFTVIQLYRQRLTIRGTNGVSFTIGPHHQCVILRIRGFGVRRWGGQIKKLYMSASRLPNFVLHDGQDDCGYISGLYAAVEAAADPNEIR